MRGRSWFRHLAGALLAGTAVWVAVAAKAQDAASIDLTQPSAADFPQITFFASVIGPDGFRVHALPQTSFAVSEDGQPVTTFTITEQAVGSRQIYALNAVEPLRRRDAQGITRLERVRQSLIETWNQRPSVSPENDLTLLVPDGALVSHATGSDALAPALQTWPATFSGTEIGYQALLEALAFALDPAPSGGMETSVIFLTPLIDRPNQDDLTDASALAATSGARIHAVLIGTLEQAGTAEALRLRQAAEATGGSFRVLDAGAGLADLESILQDSQTRYAVEYVSPASAGGPHAVELSVTTDQLTAVSSPATYSLRLEPPQVAFVQPPTQVVRQTDDPNLLLSDIPPMSLELRLLITFPDGHTRPLTELRFLVDGQAVETRRDPPFDAVTWDISSIVESGRHQLQVQVTDSQGLLSTTEILPVSIEVNPGPRGLQALRPALGYLAAGMAVVALGIAAVAAWIRVGQVGDELDPAEGGPGGLRSFRRASLGALDAGGPAEAYLVPIRPDGGDGEPLALRGADLTIGADPSLCGILLHDSSVSAIHARLTRRVGGVFTVRDQDSVAGTWVNDQVVEEAGRDLVHGDRIHFGRAAFRFRMASPGPEPQAAVRPLAGDRGS